MALTTTRDSAWHPLAHWAVSCAAGDWGQLYHQLSHRRYLTPENYRRAFALVDPAKVWQRGQDASRKRVLVLCEQGIGDCIQFLRFLPLLREQAKEVWVRSYPTLAPLVEVQPYVDGVRTVSPPKKYDLACALWDVPRLLGLQYLPNKPYLQVQGNATLPTIEGAKNIGVCWAGSGEFVADEVRSIPFHHLAPLFNRVQGAVRWWSLQVGPDPHPREAVPAEWQIFDLAPHLTDWLRTAVLVRSLDAVVCVDTAVLHLAGALGVPCYALLSNPCDWRWAGGNGDDTPWYPSVRIFRQAKPGDWSDPIRMLADFLLTSSAPPPPV